MENTSVTPQPKKRGPAKRNYVNAHVLLPPEDYEWALAQDDSFTAFVRHLIRDARRRRETVSA